VTDSISTESAPKQSVRKRLSAWLRDRRRRGKRLLPFRLSGNMPLLMGLLGSLILLVILFAIALRFIQPAASGQQISFDTLIVDAGRNSVLSAQLHDVDHRITGTLVDGTQFWTTYPSSDAETPYLLDTLVKAGVSPLTVDSQTSEVVVRFLATNVLPIVLLANLFALIFIGAQGGGDSVGGLADFASVGKGRGRKGGSSEDEGHVTFSDVAGADLAVLELAEVKDYLADPERFAALGARPPKGVMMFGPPGCGKTLMARAVAGEARVPFFSISGSEFVESLVGVGAARVRDLFRQVRSVAPAIVFIDEIDAAGRRRGGVAGGQEEREQTLNQLLIEMDGFETAEGIVVIAATNRPDILDPALLRPGRFDRQITVEPPDLDGRIAILGLYARKRPVEPDVNIEYFARRTPGFTGADLAGVVNEAALLAVRQEKATISATDFEEAVQRVMSGPRRKGHLLSDEERLRAAYHESAHALIGAATGRIGDTPRVTIVSHGRNLGATLGRSWAERTLITRDELFDELVTVMAGTASEELIFGQPSTGADADLERATQVASLMVGRYGMSEKLGKVHLLRIEGNEFLGGDMVPNDLASQPVLEEMHAEISRMLDAADEQAKELLRTHRPLLDEIVARLLEHESLEGDELAAMLHPVRPLPRELPVPAPVNGRSTPSSKAPESVRPRSAGPRQDES
jgi:cell division protease FtsH